MNGALAIIALTALGVLLRRASGAARHGPVGR